MNYAEVIKSIQECAQANLSVHSFYEGDVYVVNEDDNILYPAVILTPAAHQVQPFVNVYNFNLFYVDRLTAERDNKIAVQSTAISTLKEIMNRLYDRFDEAEMEESYPVTVFTERFTDECAGAFATVQITIEDSLRSCYYDE